MEQENQSQGNATSATAMSFSLLPMFPPFFQGWSLHLRPFYGRQRFVGCFGKEMLCVLAKFAMQSSKPYARGTLGLYFSPGALSQLCLDWYHLMINFDSFVSLLSYLLVVFFFHIAVCCGVWCCESQHSFVQVQESQPKVLFTDLPPLWFLPVKEIRGSAKTTNRTHS